MAPDPKLAAPWSSGVIASVFSPRVITGDFDFDDGAVVAAGPIGRDTGLGNGAGSESYWASALTASTLTRTAPIVRLAAIFIDDLLTFRPGPMHALPLTRSPF